MRTPTPRFALLVASLLLAPPAMAGEWSGSATLTSHYVSRGFTETWGRPTLQGGFEYDAGHGLTAGVWASGVSDRVFERASTEVDVYVGYRREFGDVTLGATVYTYRYPGARMTAVDASYDYAELIPAVTWRNVTVSYAYTVSRDYNGYNSRTLGEDGDRHSRGSGYLDISLELPLDDDTRLGLHAGRQRIRHFSAYDWTDASVGLSHDVGDDWTIDAVYSHGWYEDGIYDDYTTGIADRNGVVHTTNPLDGTWSVSITRNF